MSEKIKIRLKSGSREIEIEATRPDADALLKAWWQSNENNQSDDDEETLDVHRNKPKKKKTSRKARPSGTKSEQVNQYDANALANKIKQHKKLNEIEAKIINVSGDPYNKIALVLWVAEQALTSGDIFRTLKGLDVKSDLPTISKTLKKNSSKFLTSTQRKVGGPPSTYKLSAQTKSEFEKWLTANGG